MTQKGFTLVVEAVHGLSGRPWIMLTGRAAGAPIVPGAAVMIRDPGGTELAAVVRSIELHGAPGTTTVAVDADLRDRVRVGAVVLSAPEGAVGPD